MKIMIGCSAACAQLAAAPAVAAAPVPADMLGNGAFAGCSRTGVGEGVELEMSGKTASRL